MNQHTWIWMSYSKRRLKRTSQIGEGLRERTTTCSGENLLYEVRETQGDMGALQQAQRVTRPGLGGNIETGRRKSLDEKYLR